MVEDAPDPTTSPALLPGPLSDEAAKSFSEEAKRIAANWGLTQKQQEVLKPLVLGHSNKEIARFVGCSEVTVEYHLTQILARAGLSSRNRLVAAFWLRVLKW